MKIGWFVLRPEVMEIKYWVHIFLITIIVLGVLKYVFSHNMFNMFWQVGFAIAFSDIIVHTLLRLD